MDNRKIIAYAVDVDTGKVTWRMYDDPRKKGQAGCMVDYYLQRALEAV